MRHIRKVIRRAKLLKVTHEYASPGVPELNLSIGDNMTGDRKSTGSKSKETNIFADRHP